MRTILMTALILGLIIPIYSVGQEIDSQKHGQATKSTYERTQTEESIIKTGQDNLRSNSNDPSLTSPSSGANAQLLLKTTKLDEKRAKAQIAYYDNKRNAIYSIIIEGPIGTKGDQITWADFNGLANSVVADIGFCKYIWNVGPDIAQRFTEAVEKYKQDFLRTHKNGPRAWDDYVISLGGINSDNLPKKYYRNLFGTPLQYGARVKVGREKYSYLDPNKYNENKESKTNYALVAFGGIILPESNLYLGLNYRYQSAFKTGDTEKTCVPITDSPGVLRCYELPIRAPKKTISNLGQLEARYFINSNFALNPKITYDFNAKAIGFEIPFYFLTEDKKGLNGGISLCWRSDKKDLGLTLFIGHAFKIFHD
jgi:hypothetical protein